MEEYETCGKVLSLGEKRTGQWGASAKEWYKSTDVSKSCQRRHKRIKRRARRSAEGGNESLVCRRGFLSSPAPPELLRYVKNIFSCNVKVNSRAQGKSKMDN